MSYRFAALGALLILSSRREEVLNKVNAQLPENRGNAKVLPLDLEDVDQLPLKTEEALSFYGRIDYFISNAGLAVKDYALNTDISIDQKLMDINYFGPIVITKKLKLTTNSENDIVNITDQILQIIQESKLSDGLVTVFIPGSTGALFFS